MAKTTTERTSKEGYSATIKYVSKEINARERIMLKDTTNAVKLDEATAGETLTLTPVMYAVLEIHNDKSDNKDYENYIIVDKSGTKYVTGSQSFWSSFMEIAEEMADEDEEYSIEVYKKDSKNYKGKQFITCSII